MLLFVTGPVDPEAIMGQIRSNQEKKEYSDQPAIERRFEQEMTGVAEKKQVLKMNVQSSKCLLGVKALNVKQEGAEMLKNELTLNVMLDILFGKSSKNYETLYREGLIDETFSYDYTQEQGFGFAMLGGDTSDPDQLAGTLRSMLLEAKTGDVFSQEALDRTKKKKIGAFLRSVNSPEYIANQFTRYAFNEMDLFEVVPEIEKISLEQLKETANVFLSEDRFTVCQVVPK